MIEDEKGQALESRSWWSVHKSEEAQISPLEMQSH